MSDDAEIGYGLLVKVEVTPGSGTFETIGYQKDVKGGGWSVDQIDKSHNQSPNKVKEKMPGMTDMKPVAFEIQYKLGGEAEALLLSIRGLERTFRTVHPSGAYAEYDGFVSDFEPESPTEDKSVGSVEITPSGDMTIEAASAPLNTTRPAIAAAALTLGSILTAYEGEWANEPTSFTYQWKNAGSNIVGATNRTYALQAGDSGDAITVAVTGINSAGNATATSAPVVAA